MFQEVWGRSFCRTIEKLVEVVQEYPTEVEHIYSPSCVPLVRCAGCCGDENLECHPTRTTNVTMQVRSERRLTNQSRHCTILCRWKYFYWCKVIVLISFWKSGRQSPVKNMLRWHLWSIRHVNVGKKTRKPFFSCHEMKSYLSFDWSYLKLMPLPLHIFTTIYFIFYPATNTSVCKRRTLNILGNIVVYKKTWQLYFCFFYVTLIENQTLHHWWNNKQINIFKFLNP